MPIFLPVPPWWESVKFDLKIGKGRLFVLIKEWYTGMQYFILLEWETLLFRSKLLPHKMLNQKGNLFWLWLGCVTEFFGPEDRDNFDNYTINQTLFVHNHSILNAFEVLMIDLNHKRIVISMQMQKINRSDRLLTQNQTTFFVQPIAAVNGRGQSFDSTTFGFWSKTVNQSQSDLRPDASRPTSFDLKNSAVTIWPQEAPTLKL